MGVYVAKFFKERERVKSLKSTNSCLPLLGSYWTPFWNRQMRRPGSSLCLVMGKRSGSKPGKKEHGGKRKGRRKTIALGDIL